VAVAEPSKVIVETSAVVERPEPTYVLSSLADLPSVLSK
jgi:hypothetical protein